MKISQLEAPKQTAIKTTKQTIDKKLGIPEGTPFEDKPEVVVTSGGMRSGKSTFLNSILVAGGLARIFKKVFYRIFYFCPEAIITSDDNHPFKDHPRLYHDLTVELLEMVINECIKAKEAGHPACCIVIDDFSEKLRNNRQLLNTLLNLVQKHGHYRLSIFITVLTPKNLPRVLRSLVDNYVLFKPKTMDIKQFGEEVFGRSPKQMEEIFDYVFDKKYNFLFYRQFDDKFYKNFDPLTIEVDDK